MQLVTENNSGTESVHPSRAANTSPARLKTPEELAIVVSEFVATEGWLARVRLHKEGRWYERLYHGADYDIWVISWLPGQSTGFHDHGESVGAFVVATGVLEEHRPGEAPDAVYPDQPRVFGSNYAHDVRNVSIAPAISIHAYSPPLNEMNEYELDGGVLVPRERASRAAATLDERWSISEPKAKDRTAGLSINEMLSIARARLRRLTAKQASRAMLKSDAVLVDIRPEAQRAVEGTIEGALIVERNVLEWRFDPSSSARLGVAIDHHLQIIVLCSEGYTSSLAAASLQDLGLWRATDVTGGFAAWKAAGLPFIAPTPA